jgi:hypothetical protein
MTIQTFKVVRVKPDGDRTVAGNHKTLQAAQTQWIDHVKAAVSKQGVSVERDAKDTTATIRLNGVELFKLVIEG